MSLCTGEWCKERGEGYQHVNQRIIQAPTERSLIAKSDRSVYK